MSNAVKKGEVTELNPGVEEKKEQETPEKTIFGKIDDKIVAKRTAKAEKKEQKAQAKAAKASEGKKFNWKKTVAIGAGVVGTIGTVLAVVAHNQPADDPNYVDMSAEVNNVPDAPAEIPVNNEPAQQASES